MAATHAKNTSENIMKYIHINFRFFIKHNIPLMFFFIVVYAKNINKFHVNIQFSVDLNSI